MSFGPGITIPVLSSCFGSLNLLSTGSVLFGSANLSHSCVVRSLLPSATVCGTFVVSDGARVSFVGPMFVTSGKTLTISSLGAANITSDSDITVFGTLVIGDGMTLLPNVQVSGGGSVTFTGCNVLTSRLSATTFSKISYLLSFSTMDRLTLCLSSVVGPNPGSTTVFTAPLILPNLNWGGTVQIIGSGNFRIASASPQDGASVLGSSNTTMDGALPLVNGATFFLGGPLRIAPGLVLSITGAATLLASSQIVVAGGLVLGNGVTANGSVANGPGFLTLDGCTLLSTPSVATIS